MVLFGAGKVLCPLFVLLFVWPGSELVDDCLAPRVAHEGGSIMIWGTFMGRKLVAVHRVLGPVGGAGYVSLLKESLLPVLPSARSTAFRRIVCTQKHGFQGVPLSHKFESIRLLSGLARRTCPQSKICGAISRRVCVVVVHVGTPMTAGML